MNAILEVDKDVFDIMFTLNCFLSYSATEILCMKYNFQKEAQNTVYKP